MMVHDGTLEIRTALERHIPDVSSIADSAAVTTPRTKHQCKNQIEKT